MQINERGARNLETKGETMNNQYHKYAVYDEYGKVPRTVIAHGLNIKGDGTLEFISSGGGSPCFHVSTAIAAGYWSRVELVETVEAVG